MTLHEKEVLLSKKIKCLECAGQTIEASQALVAQDMRAVIQKKLKAGWGETEILAFLKTSYGDQILVNPPLEGAGVVLWGAPVFLGSMLVVFFLRRLWKRRK